MKGITINRKFVAALVAAASLSAPMVALPAMAAGTATPAPAPAHTGLVINAGEGQTLHGKYTAYKLGSYADVETDAASGKVKSVNVVGDANTNAWADTAIHKFNDTASASDDITVPNGYDQVGAIAQLNDKGYKTNGIGVPADRAITRLGGVSAALSNNRPSTITAAAAAVDGAGKQSITINVPDGLYLVVDTAGRPLILGTKIAGKDMTNQTLGVALVKESYSIDKKIETTIDKSWVDNSSETVGRTIKVRLTDTIPNGSHAGGAKVYKIVDTPNHLDLVSGSIKVMVGGAYTDVTSKVHVYTTAGQKLSGDATLVDDKGQRTDPDLTVPNGGFIIDASNLLAQYPGRAITVTYNAKMNGYQNTKVSSNDVKTTTIWRQGTNSFTSYHSDSSKVPYYDLTLHKTAQDDKSKKVNGAGFVVYDFQTGKYLTLDRATGNWSDAADEAHATVFYTGDANHDGKITTADGDTWAGQVTFPGLGAGQYGIIETVAPTGFRAESMSLPTAIANIGKDGHITVTGKKLPTLTKDNGNGDFTVADIDSLLQLPQTGGVWTIGTYLAAATLVAVLAAGTASYAGKRRQQAGKPVDAD